MTENKSKERLFLTLESQLDFLDYHLKTMNIWVIKEHQINFILL